MKLFYTALFLAFSIFGYAQDPALSAVLRKHVEYLASDKLEGRGTGTEGEKLAYKYLIKEFKSIGLKPYGVKNSYLQAFVFTAARNAEKVSLKLQHPVSGKVIAKENDESFKINIDVVKAVDFSGSGKVKGKLYNANFGIEAPELSHNDYLDSNNHRGDIFVIDVCYPGDYNPHGSFGKYGELEQKADLAIRKGASAIIFIKTKKDFPDPDVELSPKTNTRDIPILFAGSDTILTHILNPLISPEHFEAEIEVKIEKQLFTGNNVIGFIDNNAENTVVIGAHYDHLGHGQLGGSLFRNAPGEKDQVHNGADDNASGTAALIELARILKKNGPKGNNYLFIAFSGEELGLYGSNYFTKLPTIDLKKINYMINMDMVGRYDTTKNQLAVNGTGTSPAWLPALEKTVPKGVGLKTTESGVGSSDHTSFYLQGIPAIHFFTGTHSDYHKPDDDFYKLNYTGQAMIVRYIINLVAELDSKGKIQFNKTEDADRTSTPRLKVTMGIIPDYLYDGSGIRVDGVTEGKPAFKAGIQKGDVIIELGDVRTDDMVSYMKALNRFNKGESTNIKLNRSGQEMIINVTF